jgi:quinol monooxygenase YgiN
MQFTRHIVFEAPDEHALMSLLDGWRMAGASDGAGFQGGRLLRFRDKPNRYVLQADFHSWEAAEGNYARPETQEWTKKLVDLIGGEPKYENLDVLRNF